MMPECHRLSSRLLTRAEAVTAQKKKKPLINCRTLGGAVTDKQWRATFDMRVKTKVGTLSNTTPLCMPRHSISFALCKKMGFFQLNLTG